MGKTRAWILAHPEAPLSEEQIEYLQQATNRLEIGEPLPYVLGHWEFYGLDFTVTSDVLIPRPETELLVDQALSWMSEHPGRRFALEIGTGSGCIAISLAVNIPNLVILAIDISHPALRVATQNAIQHKVAEQVLTVAADLFPPTHKRFDLVCANLPYIPTQRFRDSKIYGKEPDLSLDGGAFGLDLIDKMVNQAPKYLIEGGSMFFEIDASQGKIVKNLAEDAFPDANVNVLTDLAGRDRLVYIQT
jgi:release factor glutamine methyltransferase